MTSHVLGRALAVFAAFGLAFPVSALCDDISSQQQNWETQYGQQQYTQLMQRGEIVSPQSPMYSILTPIGNKIAAVADREYYAPFRFILLNDRTPNAFSVPGGNVFVTSGMLMYLQNRDELAGVLCHEVNHDIHHDVYRFYQQNPGAQGTLMPGMQFTHAIESNADRAGAYTCATAGFNPWGAVWNFRLHGGTASGQGTGDHPSDGDRASTLMALFNSDPATFGRYRDDIAAATPLGITNAMQQSAMQQRPNYPAQTYGYPQQPQNGYPQQAPYGYPQQAPYGYPQQAPYGYPQQAPYGYPQQAPQNGYPQQQTQNGYPQQQSPYGYPPPGYGYPPPGYGYPPAAQQQPAPGYPPG